MCRFIGPSWTKSTFSGASNCAIFTWITFDTYSRSIAVVIAEAGGAELGALCSMLYARSGRESLKDLMNKLSVFNINLELARPECSIKWT
eukprot:COSAG02_NODE_2548_length_8557_cov_17.177229_1_plen_89_part_10